MQQKQRLQIQAMIALLLVLLLVIADLSSPRVQGKSAVRPVDQAFDAAATVTALVGTRNAILSIVTRTPGIPGISEGGFRSNAQLLVEVIVNELNIRSGPGINYPIINSANRNQQFLILGQAYNCSWLQIGETDASSITVLGWISGAAQYVHFSAACATIMGAEIPATPIPSPTATARIDLSDNSGEQGCYLIRNELGFAVTIALTSASGWDDTFQLAIGAEREYCAPAGAYQYTLNAPAPLGAIQGMLTVNAGERLLLPLKFGN